MARAKHTSKWTCQECGTLVNEHAKLCRPCYDAQYGPPPEDPNPSGLCMCGCGQPTPLATQTRRKWGHVKGKPIRFIRNHQNGTAPSPVEYIEEDRGYTTPCWIWQRAISSKDGYGLRRGEQAHRAYYRMHVGPIPTGHDVHHKCEVRPCVNPDHLEPIPKTEHHKRHIRKLSDDDVRAIRALYGTKSRDDLADQFGIAPGYVVKIAHRKDRARVA